MPSQSDVPEIDVHELKSLLDEQRSLVLIDVREKYEREICQLGGLHIPLAQLYQQVPKIDKNAVVIVYCKAGVRSAHAVRFLAKHDFAKVRSLRGGILEWIEKIDASLAVY